MKRIYLLLMLLAATAFNLAAQDDGYKPFVEEGKRWVWENQDWSPTIFGDGDVSLATYCYQIKGDTIIKGIAYKTVWKTENDQSELFGWIREENKCVYFVESGQQSKEVKLYDFDTPQATDFTSDYTFVPTTRQGRNGFVTSDGFGEAYYIEGVGFDCGGAGDTFYPEIFYSTGYTTKSLHHVEDAEGNIIYYGLGYIPPLVREGVRWIYVETTFDHQTESSLMNFYAYEFRGDSVFYSELFGSRYRYYKLYRYILHSEFDSYNLSFSNTHPVTFMRESDKKVYAPNYYAEDLTAENIAKGEVYYDFSKPDSAKVKGGYWDHVLVSIPYQSTIMIDGMPCRVFDSLYPLSHNNVFHNMVIEGVGYVGYEGDLILTNAYGAMGTGMGTIEFVCLEDLDGNVLYKGNYYFYNKYINKLYAPDITGDGKVDVADINAAVSALLGVGDNAKADVNGDGKVDIADINTVINVILNK